VDVAQAGEEQPTPAAAGGEAPPQEPAPAAEEPAPQEPAAAEPSPTPEDLFNPEELIRADEEASQPEPTPGTAIDEERRKEIADLETQAEKYFKALNYTRPPRTNVVEVAKEILNRDPQNAKVKELIGKMVAYYQKKGDEAMRSKQYGRAADQFDRILQVDLFGEHKADAERRRDEALRLKGQAPPPKEKPELLLRKAEEAFQQKNYQEARKYYQAILQQIPDDILARKGLEKCNQLLGIEPEGTPEERMAYFRQAGESFMEWGNYKEARFYYEKILAIEANDADARQKLQIIQDKLTPKGKLVVSFSGDPFWWSTRLDARMSGEEAKAHIELVMKLDGETTYYRTDSDVEEPVAAGKKGHAKNTYAFKDDYSFDNVAAGAHTLEVIVRGGAGEEAGQWTFSTPVQIDANRTTELALKTKAELKYNKRKSRMSGEFKISL
jgi:tetratricopeptide (TPR) repeat protein